MTRSNALTKSKMHFDSSRTLSILIIDDHPITCKGYTMLLNMAYEAELLPKARIDMAHSIEAACARLNSTKPFYDVVLLDIRLPAFPQQNLYNGEDFGKLIRRHSKKTKILVLTSLNNHYRIQSILKSLNPEGFILKSEICDKNLTIAFQEILNDVPFYSATVLQIIKNQLISNNEITQPERKFLHLLSTGVQSKEIPKHLPWSVSKVEKQKRVLKEKLGVEEKSSWALIHKARELGII